MLIRLAFTVSETDDSSRYMLYLCRPVSLFAYFGLLLSKLNDLVGLGILKHKFYQLTLLQLTLTINSDSC